MTALTKYPAREEEFGTTRLAQGATIAGPSVRAQVLPLLSCTSALGTQIVAALRLRFHLRKSVHRVQRRLLKVHSVLKYARSKCALIHPKQERVETNGDGVKQGYPPKIFRRGLGAQMSNAGRVLSRIGHFCPVPICFGVICKFKQARSEGAACSGALAHALIKVRRVLRAQPRHSAQCYMKVWGAGMTSPQVDRGIAPLNICTA